MISRTHCTIFIAFIISMSIPAWGQQFLLYSPQPVLSGQKSPTQEGIVVQEIEIQKGDTLFGLSRKFSGHGMYFPQILLFNNIKNPDLIYPGNILRIPVSHKETVASENIDSKSTDAPRKPKSTVGIKTVLQPEARTRIITSPAGASSGQKLFEAAAKAYRQDDCRSALELLDRYLADYSGSALAADATLYKAECYMIMSAQ